MHMLTDLADLRKRPGPVALAAGFFDGLHRGHVRVIRCTQAAAAEGAGEAWVLTFDTHPLRILNPPSAPRLLTCNRHKMRLLERLGLTGCLLLPFTPALAALEPAGFVTRLLDCCPPLADVFVGRNWRFGHEGGGGPALLARLGRAHGLRVTALPAVSWKGETISSTRIRNAVAGGRLEEAGAMLGRPFSLLGAVVRGRGIGRTLGYPTANLDSNNEVLPPYGVYAVEALIDDRLQPGVLSLGVHPTFDAPATALTPSIELHVLDAVLDLYGRDIEVFFVARLRDERRFDSAAALAARIAEDVRDARRTLAVARHRKKLEEYLYRAHTPPYSPALDKQTEK